MIEIIADDRERNGNVIERLREHAEVSLTIGRLPLGDYRIDEALLIERKTLFRSNQVSQMPLRSQE